MSEPTAPAARLRALATSWQSSALSARERALGRGLAALLDEAATLRAENTDLKIQLAVGQVEQHSQELDALRAQLAQAEQALADERTARERYEALMRPVAEFMHLSIDPGWWEWAEKFDAVLALTAPTGAEESDDGR